MQYSFLDFLILVGSLALFLYGMKIMSDALQKLAGNKLRGILSAMTRNRAMGVMTGILITALIQSSSATTVMVVSFVNAGLLSLSQSIGVIMGANIGTTVTAWIIALFGFGSFTMGSVAIPLMGLAIPLIFSSKSRNKSLGEFIFGFAFLFMGLDFLKDAMPDLQSNPEVLSFVQNFAGKGFSSMLFFLFLGSVLTVIVQSSSATVALTLIMAAKGWIDFPSAAAMVMGENVGTTITANLAAIPANVSARRAAFSHLMFNMLGVIWMMFVFKYFVVFVERLTAGITSVNPGEMMSYLDSLSPEEYAIITTADKASIAPEMMGKYELYLSYQKAASYGLSMFHMLFNLANVAIMIWFVNFYEKLCLLFIKPRKGEEIDEEFTLKYIGTGMSASAELSILQAEKEVSVYVNRVSRMLDFVNELLLADPDSKEFATTYKRLVKYEEISDRMEVEIGNYLGRVSEGRLSSDSKETIRSLLRAVTEIESIADAAYNMGRSLQRKKEAGIIFDEGTTAELALIFELAQKAFDNMTIVIENHKVAPKVFRESEEIEFEINEMRDILKEKNEDNLKNNVYPYNYGVFFMDFVNESERMGDNIINVVEALEHEKMKSFAR